MSYKILIVDDNPNQLKASELLLRARGFSVDTARTGDEAVKKIKENPWRFGLVVLDYHLKDTEGTAVAKKILSTTKNLYILMHSADETQAAAIDSIEAGAVGFIPKAVKGEVFVEKIRAWCKKYEETFFPLCPAQDFSSNESLIREIGLVGASAALANVAKLVKKYGPFNKTVLITGETGTGKERIARALHHGPAHMFFPVNCASYSGSSDLMENELFGRKKDAYTGANTPSEGVFRQAAGGTVLLDEIYTLSVRAQYKLLRALREWTVRPVGGTTEHPINCRIIVTAKPDIEELAKTDKFVPDLLERINVLRIHIPPLRDRADDIEPLVVYFCEKYAKENQVQKRFLKSTVQYLKKFPWPRNVAQLENLVTRLCARVDGDTIMPQHLDPEFFEERNTGPLANRIELMARQEIIDAINQASSRREASRLLGIPEPTLRRKLKEYGIPDRFTAHRSEVEAKEIAGA